MPDATLTAALLSPWGLGLLGLCIGSFLNVVIHRLPLMLERQWWADVVAQLGDTESFKRLFGVAPADPLTREAEALQARLDKLPALGLARPASRCPKCGHRIRWHENLPLVGWLRLGGRCAGCKARISARYPLVELATGVVFAAVAWRVGPTPVALAWCGFAATLVALSLIDWDTTVLPDALTLPLLWAGLLLALFGAGQPLREAVLGAMAGYLSLWSVYWLFKLTTGKEGMGYGDFKLLAALGAWLGWKAILPIVLMASVIGALVGVVMKFSGALRSGRYVPFGPFLAGGGLAVLLVGLTPLLALIGWA